MAAFMREFAAPADFVTSARSDILVPNRDGALYRGFLNTSNAVALVNEYNRPISSTLIPGKAAITNLTAVGTTVTATTSVAHSLANGKFVTVSGCVPAEYNGTYAVSGVTSTTFNYAVPVAPGVSPATTLGIYSPNPTYTAIDVSVTANAASPATGISTGVVPTGDVLSAVLTNKAGVMGLFSASLAASNGNIIGFNTTSTQLQFHNGNSSGQSANYNWPGDIGTKKLFAVGWGRKHGFPFMAVFGGGVLLAIVSGTVAGGDRVPAAGDHIWYWARPNGGSGVGLPSFGLIHNFIPEETVLIQWALSLYLALRALPLYAGLIY